jgi:glucosamine-6-phosphate deaminase
VGLPAVAPERFAQWLQRHLFSRVPFASVHTIVPEQDPQATAAAYAEALAAAPIDIVCLGIGVNGHIAFNDPPVADFDDPFDVKIVELDDICRQQQVDDDCFAQFEDVPAQALTLTIPRLLRAERLFCVVPGAFKRDAVQKTLSGPVTTDCPASILRTHPNCILYLDAESDPNV